MTTDTVDNRNALFLENPLLNTTFLATKTKHDREGNKYGSIHIRLNAWLYSATNPFNKVQALSIILPVNVCP